MFTLSWLDFRRFIIAKYVWYVERDIGFSFRRRAISKFEVDYVDT